MNSFNKTDAAIFPCRLCFPFQFYNRSNCKKNHFSFLQTSLFIRVEAVNEFHPQFVNAPYARSVSEVRYTNLTYKYKSMRCLKKECWKQCRYVKFKDTMTKWPVQQPTHRTTQKHVEHQDATAI